MKRTKEELIELRKEYQDPDQAEATLKELIKIYKKEYKPQHTPSQYYKLIRDYEVDRVEERHEQDTNYPDKCFETFSIVSQHVFGYTKEHCYDQIWDDVQEKKRRIAEYKLLPTLKELVESNTLIEPNKMYHTRDKDADEDSCDGHTGDIILEMREMGIDAWQSKRNKEQWEWLTGNVTKQDWSVVHEGLQKFLK